MFDKEELTNLKRNDGCMHTMVQGERENLVKSLGEYQLPVNGPQTPKHDSNKHPNWKSCRCKQEITNTTETLDKVGKEGNDEEDELEPHVDVSEIFPIPCKFASFDS